MHMLQRSPTFSVCPSLLEETLKWCLILPMLQNCPSTSLTPLITDSHGTVSTPHCSSAVSNCCHSWSPVLLFLVSSTLCLLGLTFQPFVEGMTFHRLFLSIRAWQPVQSLLGLILGVSDAFGNVSLFLGTWESCFLLLKISYIINLPTFGLAVVRETWDSGKLIPWWLKFYLECEF